MPEASHPTPIDARSWPRLAARSGIQPAQKLLLALSGGADSVFLLRVLALARPLPVLRVLHVQHSLRGADSLADERFCAELCAELEIPFRCRRVQLDAQAGSLENQARKARYGALRQEAEHTGHHLILTAHHAQDVLETLLWRWIRGSSPLGLRGPRRRLVLTPGESGTALEVARPMLDLEPEEIRAQLRAAGLTWREDLSNLDLRFTRNRLRQRLMPFLKCHAGPGLMADFARYAQTMERVEQRLEACTQELAWAPEEHGKRVLRRDELARLAPGLQKRALWRLLTESLGGGPRGVLLERILANLRAGDAARHTLAQGWQLTLGPTFLELERPKRAQRR